MTHYRLNLSDPFESSSNSKRSVLNGDYQNASWLERKLDLQITVHSDPNEIIRDWCQFEIDQAHTNTCSTWCKAWYDAHKHLKRVEPFIIVGRDRQNSIEFILPLELRRYGPMKILVAPGAGHTTYYSGLYTERVLQMFTQEQGTEFWDHVLASIGRVDAVLIEGFSVDKFGPHHPLALLPQIEAAHGSMRMDISSDWATQYEDMIPPKLKADNRRCAKRLAELGELKHVIAETPEDRHALLDVLLQQKATQFADMNVIDPFKPEAVASFYRRLIDADENKPETSLYFSALTLDNIPLAANFGLLDDGQCYGLITSMTNCDKRRFSPGRLLLGHTNGYLSSINIKAHDFGMGMLPYKSVWCQRELKRQHAQMSFSLPGRLFLWQKQSIQILKRWLKSHEGIKRILNNALHLHSRFAIK